MSLLNTKEDSIIFDKLTDRQKCALAKIVVDRNRRSEDAAKKSRYTGIPKNIILSSMDIVQWGMWLGLIQSKKVLEGSERKKPSFLGTMLGLDQQNVDGKRKTDDEAVRLPTGYSLDDSRVSENERMRIAREAITKQYESFNEYVEKETRDEISKLYVDVEEMMYLDERVKDPTERYLTACLQMMEDCVDEGNCRVATKFFESMFGFVSIDDYRRKFSSLINANDSFRSNALSKLTFPKSSDVGKTLLSFDEYDDKRLYRELVVGSMKLHLILKPFNMNDITSRVNDIHVIRFHVATVIKFALSGWFFNSPIACKNNDAEKIYLLKRIDANVRLWILDRGLRAFCINLRRKIFVHLAKLVTSVDIGLSAYDRSTLARSILWIDDYERFRRYVVRIVSETNRLVVTENDAFYDNTIATDRNETLDYRSNFAGRDRIAILNLLNDLLVSLDRKV